MKNEFDETDERRMWCLYCGMFFKCIQELEAHTKQHFIPEVCTLFFIIFIFKCYLKKIK